jgi:hypothetical protein
MLGPGLRADWNGGQRYGLNVTGGWPDVRNILLLLFNFFNRAN